MRDLSDVVMIKLSWQFEIMKNMHLFERHWFSDVTGCAWATCIQWRQRTNFTAPGCMPSYDWRHFYTQIVSNGVGLILGLRRSTFFANWFINLLSVHCRFPISSLTIRTSACVSAMAGAACSKSPKSFLPSRCRFFASDMTCVHEGSL